mgnify:CR=1 FL=1
MISAVILTKNEEKNIIDCIESVLFCDEILIIDDFSDDRTLQAVEKYFGKNRKITVLKRKIDGDFAKQRNYALEKAKGEWVLFVDADERIPQLLRKEIIYKIDEFKKTDGFSIKRRNFLWGKPLRFGEFLGEKKIRLGKKSSGQWVNRIHEVWDIKGEVQTLNNPIFHYPHESMDEFLKKLNLYSSIRAQELHGLGIRTSVIKVILYTKFKFFYNYVIKLGFLDGVRGLIVALLMSFNSFLVRGKLWRMQKSQN